MINEEIKQDVWSLLDKNSVLCILTNNALIYKTDPFTMNDLIYNPMGGGIAYECEQRNLHVRFLVAANMQMAHTRLFDRDSLTNAWLYRFPTMQGPGDEASLSIIEDSLKDLKEVCEEFLNKKIYLPRPGCGIGGLDWETEVKPLVEKYLGNYKNVYIVSK